VLAEGERPDRTTLVDWGAQLLEILAEAHAEGLLHRHLTEDEVFLVPAGLLLTGFGPPEPGDSYTVQSDLYAAGCLLRRLAFAASLRGSRGRLGPRDPLMKVLARATFADPAARYQSAAEMAEALREAGRAMMASGLRSLDRPLDRSRGADSRVAEFSPRRPSPPRPGRNPDRELWHALVLLVASLLLMTLVLTTGWLLLGRDATRARTGGLPPSPRPRPPVTSAR
jgi:serine/threonine protein kinase